MPRRNSNPVQSRTRIVRPTHVILDTNTGKTLHAGAKATLHEWCDNANTQLGQWRYRVKPIHR